MSSFICTICQEILFFQTENKDQQPLALSCGHVFHNKCLSQWKANVNKCPQCRASAQKPFRLFLIMDSEHNREDMDPGVLKEELERVENLNSEIKKKNQENLSKLEQLRKVSSSLKYTNKEYEVLISSLKDCIHNLRKEMKSSSTTISNLQTQNKEIQNQLDTYSNIKTILNEEVEQIELDKYKNLKPDVIANVVNQWKRSAQYYKQKELSDRNKYTQVLEELHKYKKLNETKNQQINKFKQEIIILKNVIESQKKIQNSNSASTNRGLQDCNHGTNDHSLKRSQNVNDCSLFDDTSPLVKKMKITTVAFGKNVQSSSNSNLSSETNHLSQNVPVSSKTKSSSLFKRTHSFKTSFDILNHFDK